jgi:hypothetical protein
MRGGCSVALVGLFVCGDFSIMVIFLCITIVRPVFKIWKYYLSHPIFAAPSEFTGLGLGPMLLAVV